MPINTLPAIPDRVAAFRTLGEACQFSGEFCALGFKTFMERSEATCGFWLVHYRFPSTERFGAVKIPPVGPIRQSRPES
ncbi:hypothetical protein D3C81_1623890 [compost metagenome]